MADIIHKNQFVNQIFMIQLCCGKLFIYCNEQEFSQGDLEHLSGFKLNQDPQVDLKSDPSLKMLDKWLAPCPAPVST